MKICYLILCHKNEKQVTTLIEQLGEEETDFFIHVDKKAKLSIPTKRNVYFVSDDNRVNINWGDMSMVIATIRLIELAIKYGPYSYIVLLSGQDFPIKSNEQIRNFLILNNGKNYIDVNTDKNKRYKRMLKRIELYYPKFLQQRTWLYKAIKKLYILATGGCNYTFSFFRRKIPGGLSYSYGSSWWVLTYECVLWMKQFIKEHKEILDFFEKNLNPDECFFQMLFMASPYTETKENNLTYVEWESNGNHPRILTEVDIPMLLNQNKLFARKFDEVIDSKAIKTIISSIGVTM